MFERKYFIQKHKIEAINNIGNMTIALFFNLSDIYPVNIPPRYVATSKTLAINEL